MKKRILHISYDFGLAKTRDSLLQSAAFDVTTAMSYADALQAAKESSFDLVILGHSVVYPEKQRLAKEIKTHLPHIPLLSLRRHDTVAVPEADYSVETAEGPIALLEIVQDILESSEKRSAPIPESLRKPEA